MSYTDLGVEEKETYEDNFDKAYNLKTHIN